MYGKYPSTLFRWWGVDTKASKTALMTAVMVFARARKGGVFVVMMGMRNVNIGTRTKYMLFLTSLPPCRYRQVYIATHGHPPLLTFVFVSHQ